MPEPETLAPEAVAGEAPSGEEGEGTVTTVTTVTGSADAALFGDGPASAQSPRPSPTPTTVTRRRRRKERRRAYLPSGMYRRPRLPEPDTPVGAILAERRAGLVADLGGEGELTTTQTALIDLVIRQWSILDSVDGYLLGMESLVDRRHRKAWPVVLDRDRLAASLERSLGRLGLERRPAPVEDVEAFVARVAAEKEGYGEAADEGD